MKNIVHLLPFALFLVSLPACEKADLRQVGQSVSSDAMEELRKLPDAERQLKSFVNSGADRFPTDVFDMDPPKVEVDRHDGSRFDLRVEHSGTAKASIYSTPPPEFVEVDGKLVGITVVEILVPKGTRKTRKKHVSVIHGPMGWGKEPNRIQWNWKLVEESGDDMERYDARGPRIGWATAEQLKINLEETASSLPEVLIKGTPDYLKAVQKHPKLATTGKQSQKEEGERFDRLLEALPRKSQ